MTQLYINVECCVELSVVLATRRPLGLIKNSRALYPCAGFLSYTNVTINVCERAIKPDSVNQS